MYYHLTNLKDLFGLDVAAVFTGTPQTVTTLDLSGNGLCQKTGAELARAFSGVPQGVTTLILRLFQK